MLSLIDYPMKNQTHCSWTSGLDSGAFSFAIDLTHLWKNGQITKRQLYGIADVNKRICYFEQIKTTSSVLMLKSALLCTAPVPKHLELGQMSKQFWIALSIIYQPLEVKHWAERPPSWRKITITPASKIAQNRPFPWAFLDNFSPNPFLEYF